MEKIAESLNKTITSISDYELNFNEGDTGELRVYLPAPLYQDEIDKLQYDIISQGVVLTAPITQESKILSIKFRKAIAPLLIIGGAVAALVTGITGWQIFKMTQLGVPMWAILLGGGALLYLAFSSKPAKQVGGLAIQAGKIYVTKRMLK